MLGAIIGDIAGSCYEFRAVKSKDIPLFSKGSDFTDDTVMTLAIAQAGLSYRQSRDIRAFQLDAIRLMRQWGREYPNRGYGGHFEQWLYMNEPKPYGSYGNGSAMRVSSLPYIAESLEEAALLARASALVTHNHPEGVKGAMAVAVAGFLALQGAHMDEIRREMRAYYVLDFTLESIRDQYSFDETCQGSIPQALMAFMESKDYMDAVRNAISLGGDADTMAAVAGGIAEAYHIGHPEYPGIPDDVRRSALNLLAQGGILERCSPVLKGYRYDLLTDSAADPRMP